MDAKYKIVQVTNLTESMMMDCYYIAARSRPNNADDIYYTLQNDVNKSGHIMFVVMENMNLRGFIAGRLISNHGYVGETNIDWLFVDTKHQRRGIGGALMRAYMEYCRDRGVSQVLVQPARTIQAKQFYTKHGFAQRGIVTWGRNVVQLGR